MPTINVRPQCVDQLQEIADVLGKSKKVLVITGAGISTNCGIPDFRSENGLYSLIQAQYDAAASAKSPPEFYDRPAKRRKLGRSVSAGALTRLSVTQEAPPSRQLRSSQSFTVPNSPGFVVTSLPENNIVTHVHGLAATPLLRIETKHEEFTTAEHESSNVNKSTVQSDLDDTPLSQSSSTSIRQSLPNLKGKDLFDSIIWADSLTTSIFYTFIASLRQKILNDVKTTTETHRFIKALRDGGRLVRNYTQNIDGLEAREGLCVDLEKGTGSRSRFSSKAQKEGKKDPNGGGGGGGCTQYSGVECVHLHGSLDALRCGLCARLSSWDEGDRHQTTLAGEAPACPWCAENNAKREGRGRRSLAVGRLRPDIVLYGEEHPLAHLVGPLITHDLSLGPDVLLILGTSLRVHGLKVMVREFAKSVHRRGGIVVFVNLTKPSESVWGDVIDYWVEWDCDAWVADLKERKEEIWLPQGMQSEEKEVKIRGPAKNPKALRADTESGAYFTNKILTSLGSISGRLRHSTKFNESLVKTVVVDDPQELCNTQLAKDMSVTLTTPHGTKRKRDYRPSSVRPNKDSGAFLVPEIVGNLKGICQGFTTGLITRVKGRTAFADLPSNVPRRAKAKKKNATKIGNDQLPTPPASDEASSPLVTPKTQRIKRMSSISAILSSPLSGGGRLRIWRN